MAALALSTEVNLHISLPLFSCHSSVCKRSLSSLLPFTLFQVALLFLTKAEIPHERTWARWLQQVAGELPLPAVRRQLCEDVDNSTGLQQQRRRFLEACSSPTAMGHAVAAAGATAVGVPQALKEAIADQQLFDVYVHPAKDFAGGAGTMIASIQQ